MKLTKTASGKRTIKISQSEWKEIGKTAGWIRKAFRDQMELGPTPVDEECAQVGDENYRQKAIEECRKYIGLIRKKLGVEPEGARLKILSNPHDFGNYYEVACVYNDQFLQSVSYAYACESDGPRTWDDTTPVTVKPLDLEDDEWEEDTIDTPPQKAPVSNLPPSLPGWD